MAKSKFWETLETINVRLPRKLLEFCKLKGAKQGRPTSTQVRFYATRGAESDGYGSEDSEKTGQDKGSL